MANRLDATSYRVIAFRRGGSELAVSGERTRFALPKISVPPFGRLAEALTGAIKEGWGNDAICLFSFELNGESTREPDMQFQVVEIVGAADLSPQMRWMSVASLKKEHFHSATDYPAIEEALRRSSTTPGSFARFGWFADLETWVEESIQPLGLTLTGRFRQFNGSATFNLIRFETNGPAVWFKAVGEPNLREFSATLTLANLFPTAVPRVIAAREESHAWLTLEAAGLSLAEFRSVEQWGNTATAFARLQIASIGYSSELLQAGAREFTTPALSELVEPVFARIRLAMEQQTKTTPQRFDDIELQALKTDIQEALYALSQLGIPDALGHFDLNPANVTVSQDACTFLDWAEAYIGNPFLTLQLLVEHCRRAFPSNLDVTERITSAYLEPWLRDISRHTAAEGMRLSSLLAVFAYAAAGTSSTKDDACLEESRASYLRALSRRMKREADQLRSQVTYV